MGFKYPELPPVVAEETEDTNIETNHNQSTEAEQVREQ
jgi:hypothetical protein